MSLCSLAHKAVSAYLRLWWNALLLICGVHLARFAWRRTTRFGERAIDAIVEYLGQWLVTCFGSDGTGRTTRSAHGGRIPSTQTASTNGKPTWRLDSVRQLLEPLLKQHILCREATGCGAAVVAYRVRWQAMLDG